MERSELERLIRAYTPAVTRLAYARTGNLPDGEDVAQEVFLRLLDSNRDFTSDEHAKAWLLRVTLNVSAGIFRGPWHRRVTTLEEADGLPAPAMPEEGGMLERVLNLPVKYRTVLHLYYYEGYSTKEIANLLDRQEDTIRKWMSRGRLLLKAELKGDEGLV